MKFIVSSSLLYKELQNLGGIINSANTIPILDNFLFNIEKKLQKVGANIRRISEYASDIAEIVLNMNIEKTLKKTV